MAAQLIEVELGPAFRTCLDCLDLCRELFDSLPEWAGDDRKELYSRVCGLAEVMEATLRSRPPHQN